MNVLRTASPAQDRLLLQDVSWESFEQLSNVFAGQPVRLTYDRGTLEIKTPSRRHECVKNLIARLTERLAEELDTNTKSIGSASQQRRSVERSLEPDESYYIANGPVVRYRDDLDFDKDPPPDLVLEADITDSSMYRMGIYAAMQVPELWRYDRVADDVLFYGLNAKGAYKQCDRSLSFPILTSGVLSGFIRQRHRRTDLEIVKSFVAWVQQAKQSEADSRNED